MEVVGVSVSNATVPSKISPSLKVRIFPHQSNPVLVLSQTGPSSPLVRTQVPKNASKSKSKKLRFLERDAFPQSLPLHTKNPHSIYKDIQKFARQGKIKEALIILDYMENEGIPVNATTFSSLLTACTRLKLLTEGKQVHVHICINRLDKNEFLCTKLVEMYTSCGLIEDAKRIFLEFPIESVYPWNALLRGSVVSGNRQYHETLYTYSKMRELDVNMNQYTFSCLIKSFAGAPALSQGMKIHALLIKNGFICSSPILKTSLIDMYFKCSKVRLAWQLFDEIFEEDKDVVVWGAMIAGFAHNRLRREALEYLRWMGREGIEPNSVILTTILPVIGEMSARKVGQEVHAYVIKTKDYANQVVIQSALIDMYCKCGDMGSGRHVFYGSMERNAISWTALMSGYVSNGRLQQALRSIAWMQQEGVKPDVVSVATVLPVCGKLKALKQGKEIHGYAMKNGFLPNVSISTSLMIMYSKCGSIENSCKLFESMEKRNVISWTAMIDAYLKNNFPCDALRMFRSMQLSKHRPDSVAFVRSLETCGKLSASKCGKEIHGQILKKDLQLIPFVSSALISMYGRCREIEKAETVFSAFTARGSMTWTAIIEAYGCNGRYGDALSLFDRMQGDGFRPNEFTFSVVLSICERAGFDDEALQIFDLMVQKYHLKACEEHYTCIIDLLTRGGKTAAALRFINMKSELA